MREAQELVVLGAGGHAKVVVATLQAAGRGVSRVLDDDPDTWGTRLLGVPVEGPIARLSLNSHPCLDAGDAIAAIAAIGDNRIRQELTTTYPLAWATAVHPRAWVDPRADVGEGSVVFAGAVVEPDAVLEAHVIVNTGAVVNHDCRVGSYVHVAPAASLAGGVEVGEGSLIGMGSVVLPGVRLGAWVTVGAGAVVVADVADHATVVGVPARVRKEEP